MTQEHGAAEWAQFAQTGSVYDYLNYKLQQARDKEGSAHADLDQRAGLAAGEGGRGGPDLDHSDA